MMTRSVGAALLLLAVSGAVSGAGIGAAEAAPAYHARHDMYGCVDPRATTALAIPDGRLRDRAWVAYVHRAGRCFPLAPAERLDLIERHRALVLVRRVPPRVGEPPLYVRARDVAAGMPKASPTPAPLAIQPPPVVTAPAGVPGPATAPDAPPPVMAPSVVAPPAVAPPPPAAPAPAVPPPAPADTAPAPAPAPDTAKPAVAPPPPSVAPPSVVPPPAAPAPAPVVPDSTTAIPLPPTGPDRAAPPVVAPTNKAAPSVAPAEPWSSATPNGAGHRGLPTIAVVLVVLILLMFVAVALWVARSRRRFAHVEEDGWPPHDVNLDDTSRLPPGPPLPVVPGLSQTEFRKQCAAALEQAGWTTQMAFTAGGSGPDIVARRGDAVMAIRCRRSEEVITGEMVDEAAAMGTRHGAGGTALISNAGFTRLARDEAERLGVHLLEEANVAAFAG